MEEPEPARRVESVEFEPVPVGDSRGRRRSPLVVGAWLVVLASFVAFAALGRAFSADTATRPVPTAAVTPPAAFAVAPRLGAELRPDVPATFAITVATTSSGLAIKGIVLARSVVRVSIRLVDVNGAAIATRSIPIEHASGGIPPVQQRGFSLLLGLSANDLLAASFLEVDGYDSLGATVGSALRSLATLLGPCGAGRPCGAS